MTVSPSESPEGKRGPRVREAPLFKLLLVPPFPFLGFDPGRAAMLIMQPVCLCYRAAGCVELNQQQIPFAAA